MKLFQQHIEQYLLLLLSLSFLTGIFSFHLFPVSQNSATALSVLCFFPTLFFIHKPYSQLATICLLLLVFSLGFSRLAHHTEHFQQQSNIYSRISEETDVVLCGTLHSMPLFDGEKSTLVLTSHSLRKKQDADFSAVTGTVLLKLKGKLPNTYKPGDELVVRCKLSHPYKFGNPGGFDYPAFLAAKDIALIGRIQSTAHIHALQYQKTLLHKIHYFPEQMRYTISNFLNQRFTHEHAAIYRALLIGDRSGIGKDQFESFKASGVVHIFAISGIHLSLVATTLFLLFYWLIRRSTYLLLRFSCKKLALLSTIPFLTAYALLAGAQTPVFRSLIMVLIFIVAFCIQRQRSPLTTLSFAALLILIENPLSLFTVSFQLSFLAVASLILLLPKLNKLLRATGDEDSLSAPFRKRVFPWIIAALLVSITATLGTAPLLLYYFNRISTVGPLANLLLEPLLCLWSLPIGLLATPFIYISPAFAEFLFTIGNGGISIALYLSDFFAGLSFSTVWFATPSVAVILSYYVAIYFYNTQPSVKTGLLFILICTLFFLPPRSFLHTFSKHSELIFLDVGQGNATLVMLPYGKTILIDGGGATSSKFNVGESVIAPYLWYRGVTHLDAILISHPDADHYNGIPFLLKQFQPNILLINGDNGHDQRYLDLLQLAENLNINIQKSEGNQMILKSGMAQVQNISNPLQNAEKASSNDKSIILRFRHGNFTSIMAGDISKLVEEQLILNETPLQTDILLSPHHGSITSNSALFLKKVAPQQIIVSAGRFRPNHFPSAQLRDFCSTHMIPLLNTATDGAIEVKFTNDSMAITSFRQHN